MRVNGRTMCNEEDRVEPSRTSEKLALPRSRGARAAGQTLSYPIIRYDELGESRISSSMSRFETNLLSTSLCVGQPDV
jgi:hypothetical protein